MKVEKIVIQSIETVDIDIIGITLLSIEEYNKYRDLIPVHDSYWWLRSPNPFLLLAVYGVRSYDNEVDNKILVADEDIGISPALKISNLESSDLKIGNKFMFGGKIFTIISDDYAQCDEIIGKGVFRKDWEILDRDANDYEVSDVKKYINNWFEKAKMEIGWVRHFITCNQYECPKCGWKETKEYHYCPNCGDKRCY